MTFDTKRIGRFILVGGTGFIVDAAFLQFLLVTGVAGPFAARIISIILAAFVTWRLNRRFTFGPSETGQAAEGARYGSVVAASSAINYAIYAGLLMIFIGLTPFFALVVASIGAMCFSYAGFNLFAFARPQRPNTATG